MQEKKHPTIATLSFLRRWTSMFHGRSNATSSFPDLELTNIHPAAHSGYYPTQTLDNLLC